MDIQYSELAAAVIARAVGDLKQAEPASYRYEGRKHKRNKHTLWQKDYITACKFLLRVEPGLELWLSAIEGDLDAETIGKGAQAIIDANYQRDPERYGFARHYTTMETEDELRPHRVR